MIRGNGKIRNWKAKLRLDWESLGYLIKTFGLYPGDCGEPREVIKQGSEMIRLTIENHSGLQPYLPERV